MRNKFFKAQLLSLLLCSAAVNAQDFNGYIVKFKDGANFHSRNQMRNLGSISKVVETHAGTFAKFEPTANFAGDSLESLQNDPNVEYVEPNYIVTTLATSKRNSTGIKDARFEDQWGLNNTGKGGSIFSPAVKGEDINALKAWSITKGSSDIKIAVIDTGIDYNHPDLKNQMWVNEGEIAGNGIDDDNNGYVDDVYGYNFSAKNGDPRDGNGHGTHCAGVIGAEHNSIGVAGVMANVKMIGVKFLSDSGSGETVDAIAAVNYAIERGVDIMSNSWGGGGMSKALGEVIQAANDAGIVFVAAAGNEYSNNDRKATYPANYDIPNVISVAAFTQGGKKSSFSNYGKTSVHVAAPGSKIMSTFKNGGYESLDGTSMAAPHVSGIVGLLLSQEPNMSPELVRERLIKTSTNNSKLDSTTVSGGRVDAYRALMNK